MEEVQELIKRYGKKISDFRKEKNNEDNMYLVMQLAGRIKECEIFVNELETLLIELSAKNDKK